MEEIDEVRRKEFGILLDAVLQKFYQTQHDLQAYIEVSKNQQKEIEGLNRELKWFKQILSGDSKKLVKEITRLEEVLLAYKQITDKCSKSVNTLDIMLLERDIYKNHPKISDQVFFMKKQIFDRLDEEIAKWN